MPKTKISEFSATPANNTDIDSINIAEGCAPSGINDAIRELMAQLKDFQTGAVGDSFNGPVGTTTAAAGAFTTLSASSTVTLSGGTANGVAYLNGSKVVTSGSALTFDGTNLGIGTSSPNYPATIYKATFPTLQFINSASGTTGGDGLLIYLNGTTATISNEESGSLTFQTAGTLRATLDSSGNLGLGVTPSAWYSTGYSALQVKGSSLYSTSGNDTNLISNAYLSTTPAWTYISTAAASRYEQVSGKHLWHIAPSGTAGNAITFTQAMTLDASGNLGLGETSPSAIASGFTTMLIKGANGGGIRCGTTNQFYIYSDSTNAFINQTANGYMAFATNNTERARIDSSGNLLVGTTTLGGEAGFGVSPNASVGAAALYWNRSTSTSTSYVQDFRNAGSTVGYIAYNNTSVTYSTSSDYRLKNTIAPMTGALAKVALLKPVTYKWNADGSDGEGFIAHELAEVVPQCVTGEKDAVDENGNPKYQGIDTSFLVATLTAAIKEQQAIIESLKARLDAANL